MDCSPLGSSVHRIFQAGILEWVTIFSSRGSCWPRDWTPVSPASPTLSGGVFTTVPPGKPSIIYIPPQWLEKERVTAIVRPWGNKFENWASMQRIRVQGKGMQREGKNLNYRWHCCAIDWPKNCPLPLNSLPYEIIETSYCGGYFLVCVVV